MQDEFLENIYAHQALIHKICRMYRNTREDQEDLFQEIVYQLWKSYPNFRKEAKLSTWMYRIALNTAMASFRKPGWKASGEAKIPDRAAAQSQEHDESQEEQLYAAIRKLDDGDKAIVGLYLENMSYAEMARITGLTENYLGVRLNRIKKKIKELIKK